MDGGPDVGLDEDLEARLDISLEGAVLALLK